MKQSYGTNTCIFIQYNFSPEDAPLQYSPVFSLMFNACPHCKFLKARGDNEEEYGDLVGNDAEALWSLIMDNYQAESLMEFASVLDEGLDLERTTDHVYAFDYSAIGASSQAPATSPPL
ncbi:hypothetical protein [Vibrio parahaemolyticus]|uniref:hypothetical protein n=1 Tax=Vibrio parahaemolyticus TaxID=670 RepID=UPI0023ECE1BE|nr:hypothetical protein [Vibrio parahaemolyticus]